MKVQGRKLNRPSAWFTFALLILVGVTSGCTSAAGPLLTATPTLSPIYQIDPAIREYYEIYGGAKVFGEPISQMVEQAGSKFQFTTAVLWVVDPNAPLSKIVRLAPLGASIIPPDQQDPPQPAPDQPDPYYDHGYYIYEPFRPLYDRLEGQKFVGRPLTALRYNALTDRYEQYFENLGFYIAADQGSQVGLLNYGAWLCNSQCRSTQQLNGTIQHSPAVRPPFDVIVARLGRDFTGEPLAMAAQGPDGRLEQVFANLVLVADAIDASNPDLVTLRPMVEQLGILPAPLAAPSQEPNYFFYEVSGGQGYNIPLQFKNLIDEHGGFQVSGAPTGELAQINERITRQCFHNLCIDFDATAPPHLRIRPAALGADYFKSNLRAPISPTAGPESLDQISVQVWEAQDQVASDQEQEIYASLSQNGKPLADIKPVLIIQLPDGSQARYEMPASGSDGRTSLKIPPISAANGSLIPYQVCVPQKEQMFCIRQEYLILNLR